MKNYKITVYERKSKEYLDKLRTSCKAEDCEAILKASIGHTQNLTVPAYSESDLRKWAEKQGLMLKSIQELL